MEDNARFLYSRHNNRFRPATSILLYFPSTSRLLLVDPTWRETYEREAQIKRRFFERTELGGPWLASSQPAKFPICNSALFPDRLTRPRARAKG